MTSSEINKYNLTGWGVKSSLEFDIELPSGQTCLVKKLGMEKIVELGLMNDLDSFTGSILPDKKTSSKKTAKQKEQEEEDTFLSALKDKERFGKMMSTVDKVVRACVIMPQVNAVPEKGFERLDGVVYVDNIDFNDKLTIFGKVFDGLGGMEPFRKGQEPAVGAVAESPGASLQAE